MHNLSRGIQCEKEKKKKSENDLKLLEKAVLIKELEIYEDRIAAYRFMRPVMTSPDIHPDQSALHTAQAKQLLGRAVEKEVIWTAQREQAEAKRIEIDHIAQNLSLLLKKLGGLVDQRPDLAIWFELANFSNDEPKEEDKEMKKYQEQIPVCKNILKDLMSRYSTAATSAGF